MIVPRRKCGVLLAVVIANVAIFILAFLYTTQHWELEGLAVSNRKHRRPKPPNLTLTASVPKHYVPTVENGRRLLVIGDIHGMNTELGNLLDLAKYDAATDHVITLGDMVNKGPDSRGVLSRLMSLNASAVRGNHEDRLLLALQEHGAQVASATGQGDAVLAARKRDKKILKVAKTLLPEQITWLSGLPVILKSPALRLYFVHGGLVPGVKLDKQDPWAVMNMRTLRYPQDELRRGDGHSSAQDVPEAEDEYDDEGSEVTPAQKVVPIPIDDHSGQRWDKAWNKYQRKFVKKSHRRTVMYGHDAKRGFTEGRYTVGLDSGCAAGGHLTGLIVKARGRGGISYDKIRVSCKAA
ncbi:Ser/Thr protein phosphatase family, partial [Metarhizium majus ARSEF 297]